MTLLKTGLLTFLLLLSSCANNQSNIKKEDPKKFYGEEFTRDNPIEITKALKNFEDHKEKKIQINAKVKNVCKKKGCWMGLGSHKDENVRVTFKDYGFFVPITLVNKDVILEGILSRKELSEKMAKHYLQDAGATKEEIQNHTGSVYEYSFLAHGVEVI